MKKFLVVSVIGLFLSQCSTVPITGRKRLNFVSDSQVLPASFQQYSGFLEENKAKLVKNTSKANEIKAVGKRISKAVDKFMRANGMASEANAYKWEFNLIDDPTVNAWCMPGGKVVFYSGILPMCANTDGIAAVMGHEVAHAFAKHGQERMSSSQVQKLGGMALNIALVNKDPKQRQLYNMAYGIGTQVGVMLPFSRTHETEADKLGLVFMLMAGYRGEEAAEVWVRMSKRAGGSKSDILSTHPSNEKRIKTLKAYLPEAKRLAKKYSK